MRTCHEPMHMEQRHDQQGAVLGGELVCGCDVDQAGCQVAMAEGHCLGLAGSAACVQQQSHIIRLRWCGQARGVLRGLD